MYTTIALIEPYRLTGRKTPTCLLVYTTCQHTVCEPVPFSRLTVACKLSIWLKLALFWTVYVLGSFLELTCWTQLNMIILTPLNLICLTQLNMIILTQLSLICLTQLNMIILTRLNLICLTQLNMIILTRLNLICLTQLNMIILTQLNLIYLTQLNMIILTQ